MKTLDFKGAVAAGTAVVAQAARAVAATVKATVRRRPVALSPDAAAELERRAEINARGAAIRAARDAAIFGGSSGAWIPPRPDWLKRRR